MPAVMIKLPFTLVTGCTTCILVLSHVARSWATSWGYSEFCLNLAQVVQYQQCEFGQECSASYHALVARLLLLLNLPPSPSPHPPPSFRIISPLHSCFLHFLPPLHLLHHQNPTPPGYRVFTFGLIYYNSVHLVLVTTALLTLGTRMERHIGSVYLINALLALAIVVPLLHLLAEVAVVYFYRDLLYECFVGISSILCAMFVLEVSRAKKHWESILGYCSLSWWVFPWLTAILCEIITRDHIAFLGHIAGIIAGHMCILSVCCRR